MPMSLERILTLEQLDSNLFRSMEHCENFRKPLFGGQVLGQALMAGFQTVEGDLPNSLHAYFLRSGSSESPVIYDVEKVRDGRSFTSRRAVARQFGRPIFNLSASFHKPEQGYEHQDPFPENIPQPEEIIAARTSDDKKGYVRELGTHASIAPFEILLVTEELFSSKETHKPEGYFWIKTANRLSDNPIIHHCALAFASDLGLLATALLPHEVTMFDGEIFAASVDHAMWFHRSDFRADEWLLCRTFSPWAGKARGFALGSIFNQKGELIASTAQEGLIRPI